MKRLLTKAVASIAPVLPGRAHAPSARVGLALHLRSTSQPQRVSTATRRFERHDNALPRINT
jgi:hypothetical protein